MISSPPPPCAPLYRYWAQQWSLASLFWLSMGVIAILCPFFIVHDTYDLWVKNLDYWEQPRFSFDHSAIVLLRGAEYTTYVRVPTRIVWCGCPSNSLYLSNTTFSVVCLAHRCTRTWPACVLYPSLCLTSFIRLPSHTFPYAFTCVYVPSSLRSSLLSIRSVLVRC